jgi:hypothetical protein
LRDGVKHAWDMFRDWYCKQTAEFSAHRAQLAVRRCGDGVEISDGRAGKPRRYILAGLERNILDFGHHAPKVTAIAERSDKREELVQEALAALKARGLILELGDRVLSLPLRPKAELVANLYASSTSGPARRKADAWIGM